MFATQQTLSVQESMTQLDQKERHVQFYGYPSQFVGSSRAGDGMGFCKLFYLVSDWGFVLISFSVISNSSIFLLNICFITMLCKYGQSGLSLCLFPSWSKAKVGWGPLPSADVPDSWLMTHFIKYFILARSTHLVFPSFAMGIGSIDEWSWKWGKSRSDGNHTL